MTSKKLDIINSVTPAAPEAPYVGRPTKEVTKEKIAELIREETRLVKGTFQCFETPDSTVKITVKKYPGIPHFEMEMTDGQTYEIPLYVARHLNGIDVSAGALGDPNTRNPNIGTCSVPVHGFKWNPGAPAPSSQLGDRGQPVPLVGIVKRKKRYGFQSMEFEGMSA